MSHRSSGRLVGTLFLAAFALYGGGGSLADQPVGLGLMLLNSVAVATIGVVTLGVLRTTAPGVAWTYLAVRVAEAVLLAAGVFLLASGNTTGNDLAYAAAMVVLGVGSVPFCRALSTRLGMPAWFAWWGVVGYALLAVGAVLGSASPGAGLVLAAPGGLFEVALGLFLLVRGFPVPTHAPPTSDGRLRPGPRAEEGRR
ncbi:DUF4386 family protein [Nocardiopsis lucentensis]|uniref:DUF4386 family protein n=1 Tax=Nocardiopsis lucentensis TaxID=53441 RepID=UPI00034C82C0|nr:DUF4386 family protein [Nocardiopsis lucentensis]